MKIPESLRPILGLLKKVRYSHHDCWRARCVCGSDELRIFELGLEVRCLSCGTESVGVAQFLEKFIEEKTARVKARDTDLPGEEAPKPKKARLGSCEYCGAEFEILPYTRRRKQYCGSRCQKRAERERRRGN
jgi:hypothetical protein